MRQDQIVDLQQAFACQDGFSTWLKSRWTLMALGLLLLLLLIVVTIRMQNKYRLQEPICRMSNSHKKANKSKTANA